MCGVFWEQRVIGVLACMGKEIRDKAGKAAQDQVRMGLVPGEGASALLCGGHDLSA